MKNILLATALLSAGLSGYGQCEKKVVLTSSKTEHLNADSTLERAEDEKTVIEFDRSSISISPGNDAAMVGKVDSYVCNWSVPYKTGKTQLRITLSNPQGETKKVTITVTGKDGKITLYAELDDAPDKKIRLFPDTFTEKS